MLFLFEAGGLHPRMAYVLDGEPASTSRKPALVLIGSPCVRVRSGSVKSRHWPMSAVSLLYPQADIPNPTLCERAPRIGPLKRHPRL
jgi:hypothetical protein